MGNIGSHLDLYLWVAQTSSKTSVGRSIPGILRAMKRPLKGPDTAGLLLICQQERA
jgi:hypothetical protein